VKALKYDTIGKIKYDALALILVLLLLFLGVFLGATISPWLLISCLTSPFVALLYQSQSLIEFRNIEINVVQDKIELQYSDGKIDKISFSELESIEVDIKRDFAQLVSFPIKIKTNLKKYSLLFCGLEGENNINQFILSLSGKTSCKFIDKKNLFMQKIK
jgi:hypothetical protein